MESRQEKWRHADFNGRAAAVLTNFKLTLANQAIRLQMFEGAVFNGDVVDGVGPRGHSLADLARVSLFDHLALVRVAGWSGDVPTLEPLVLGGDYSSGKPTDADELAAVAGDESVRSAIQYLLNSQRSQVALIKEGTPGPFLYLCVRSQSKPGHFFVFIGPADRFAPNLAMVSDRATMIVTQKFDGAEWAFRTGDSGAVSIQRLPKRLSIKDFEYVFEERSSPTYRLMSSYAPFGDAVLVKPGGTSAVFWVVFLPGVLFTVLGAGFLNALMNQRDYMEQQVEEKTRALLVETNKARASVHIKTQFLANVSHEIRTPLNMILGMADLSAELSTSELQKDYLYNLKNAGRHLMVLIDDILEMSRIECKDTVFSMSNVDILALAENIAMMAWPSVQKKGLDLRLDFDLSVPRDCTTDPSRIQQIILNLVNNAVKYTPSGYVALSIKRLGRVQTGAKTECIEFKVKDSGLGIEKEKQADVFRPFFQIGRPNVASSGVGLGLAIINGIVNKLNGSIVLQSDKGRGTEFTVRIPVKVNDPRPWTSELVLPASGPKARVGIALRSAEASERLAAIIAGAGRSTLLLNTDRLPPGQLVETLACECDEKQLDVLITDQGVHARDVRRLFRYASRLVLYSERTPMSLTLPNVDYLANPVLPSKVLQAIGWLKDTRQEAEAVVPILGERENSRSGSAGDITNERLSLIIADDDPSNHVLLSAYFANTDWKIRFVNDGQEAFDACQIDMPDVVIADLQMPKMDGFQLLKKLRQFADSADAKVPKFIVVTADAMPEAGAEAKRLNVDLFLTKPVSKFELTRAVSRVMHGPNETTTLRQVSATL